MTGNENMTNSERAIVARAVQAAMPRERYRQQIVAAQIARNVSTPNRVQPCVCHMADMGNGVFGVVNA